LLACLTRKYVILVVGFESAVQNTNNRYCTDLLLLHFWVGSFCGVLDNNSKPAFPRGVSAISDIITLIEDMRNQIPDKSWMLYLLEIFNRENISVELNLICQFDNQDYFEAIFGGVNRYRFKQVLPIIGHSYLRQIIMNYQKQYLGFILEDQNTKQIERFDLLVDRTFIFEAQNHFPGIEWWNKIGNFPYPIRYHVEISQLMYGLSDTSLDPESMIYEPYYVLVPTNEGSGKQCYPISFSNIRLKAGCIYYNVKSGNCKTGMKYLYKE
jgi:hypothetical protein